MNVFRQKRAWFWIAVAVAAIAIVALLLPHTSTTSDQQTWLALLPILFGGFVAALIVRPLTAVLAIGHPQQASALAPSFQRLPSCLA